LLFVPKPRRLIGNLERITRSSCPLFLSLLTSLITIN
jgi:hypothetical protein